MVYILPVGLSAEVHCSHALYQTGFQFNRIKDTVPGCHLLKRRCGTVKASGNGRGVQPPTGRVPVRFSVTKGGIEAWISN
jgi:hypothetical protein